MIRLIVLVAIFLIGCEGQCFTLDGTYKDWSGGFTWCLDGAKSEEAGRPVVTNEVQQSATLINEAEAIAITEKLTQVTPSMKASSLSNFAEFNKSLREIMEHANVKNKNQ